MRRKINLKNLLEGKAKKKFGLENRERVQLEDELMEEQKLSNSFLETEN